ncbi:Na+/H+ antiporter NhaA [Solilutibacter silvestris]|uniref:Na(+)/H(+) antiporter NhaA n=1 Tax=Solilutibacter silvestris TaxID=1645665 RepID=A0A2K1Q2A1_9GAMM|nr:Na+/H+ antiporter NhaA [Lysobacter silvestris]PNS09180.1 NhaA: Na+/H+ antiporter NhaA [Lysobacter silvestris]
MPEPVTKPAPRHMRSRALRALQAFFRLEAAGGMMLIAAATLALVLANSPLQPMYAGWRDLPLPAAFLGLHLPASPLHWINDGLMAVFFLLVALEIKREMVSGQLSGRNSVLLPLVCAFGGMAVPGILYLTLVGSDSAARAGWAIPTATDIAFSLGVLALLGSRVSNSLRLLLSTIAIADDLGAILIIAFFYAGQLSWLALACAVCTWLTMLALNRLGIRAVAPYLLLGVVMWICMLQSGVHATLAGVVTGMMIPHRDDGDEVASGTPLESLEHALHPWVAYAILPLFAFANAGLAMDGMHAGDLLHGIPLAVIAGLAIGKPVGICAGALICHLSRIAKLPAGVSLRALPGLGMLCGIGFTMSLFIASLAFGADHARFDGAVLGVLCGSLLSALLGLAWLRLVAKPADQ